MIKMQNNVAGHISKRLFQKFGIEWNFDSRKEKEGDVIILRPKEVLPREGFQIRILIGWKKITLAFQPEDNSGELLLAMGNSKKERLEEFSVIAKKAISEGASIEITLNGVVIPISQEINWPRHWQQLHIILRSPFIETDSDLALDGKLEEHVLVWVTFFISLLFTVLPLQEETQEENLEGLPEGAQTKVLVNRYERSRVNRQICIAKNGAFCNICGFDFGKQYGKDGDGFIEVHHLTPVSKLGGNYNINPVTDLIPVCANCHAMIHRRNPPYSVDEMKNLLSRLAT